MYDSVAISLNFLSVTADSFSILPDSAVLYYEMQPTSCLHKAPWRYVVAHFSPRLHESLLGALSRIMNCTILFPEIHKQIWRFISTVLVDPVESSEGLKAMKFLTL